MLGEASRPFKIGEAWPDIVNDEAATVRLGREQIQDGAMAARRRNTRWPMCARCAHAAFAIDSAKTSPLRQVRAGDQPQDR
jgi:hypothetical protein